MCVSLPCRPQIVADDMQSWPKPQAIIILLSVLLIWWWNFRRVGAVAGSFAALRSQVVKGRGLLGCGTCIRRSELDREHPPR